MIYSSIFAMIDSILLDNHKKDHLLVFGLSCRNVRKGTNNRQDSVYVAIEKSEEEKRRKKRLV